MNDGDLPQAGQASLKSLSRQAPFAPCLPFWMSASPCGLPGEDDVDVSRNPLFLSFKEPLPVRRLRRHPQLEDDFITCSLTLRGLVDP